MVAKPEIRYRGNHQKHSPKLKVLEVVGEILLDIGNRLQSPKIVSAVVDYDDDANLYTITFACEGRIFVTVKHLSGWEFSEIREFGSGAMVLMDFTPTCLMEKAIIPFLSNLLKKEKRRINDFLGKVNNIQKKMGKVR